MIRLDHHSAALSPNPKQSPDSKIISWDDGHFLQDAVTVESDVQKVFDSDKPPNNPTVTPIDQTHTHSSPPSPPDGNSTSPNREASSSLSPVPPLAEEKEAPIEIPQREEEEEEEPAAEEQQEKPSESRQSTPLSEPPDQDDEQDEDGEDAKMDDTGKETKNSPEEASVDASVPAPTSPPTVPTPPPPQMSAPQKPSVMQNFHSSQAPTPPSNPGDQPAPMTPTIPSTTLTSSNPATQDSKVVTILELNVELLKVCMLFQAKGVPNSDSRFQQYSNRLQSNLAWLASAADQGRGSQSNMAYPIMEPPPTIGDSERIRQIYAGLPSMFAKDMARKQHMSSSTPTPSASLSTPSTPVLSGAAQANLKRERPDDVSVDGMMNKRRDTGEGKAPSLPPTPSASANSGMMPPPSSIPLSAQNSGSSHFSPLSASTSPVGINGSGMHPGHPGQQQLQRQQSPQQQLNQQQPHHQHQPPQRPSSSLSASSSSAPLGAPQGQMDSNLNLPGFGINPTEAQLAAANRERLRNNQIRMAQAQQAQMRGSGGGGSGGTNLAGIDPTVAGLGRPDMPPHQQAEMQRRLQMQQQMQQRQGGGSTGMDGVGGSGMMNGGPGVPGGMGIGGPGSGAGGMNLGMSQNSSMMNGLSNISGGGGGGGGGGPGLPRGGNPMNAAGGTGNTHQQLQVQQAYQVLNTPNHPLLQYMMRSIPGFEGMSTQQQISKMLMVRANMQQQQNRQQEQQQQQQNQIAAMARGTQPSHMQHQMGGGGGGSGGMSSMPSQLQQHAGSSGGAGFPGGGMNSPASPLQHQSMSNQQNQMFGGMGGGAASGMGNMSMGVGGGSGMGGVGGGSGAGGIGMGGVGSMDPRMMGGNVSGGMNLGGNVGGAPGNMSQHQQRQLLLMQQQRASGNVGINMGGGPGPGGGMNSVGGGGGSMNPNAAQFAGMGNMGPGNVSSMMQQPLMQERLRQQAGQGPMSASSPTHGGSPMGSDGGFAGPSAGPSMRSGSTIPGIARSTRSPSDSAPSPLASRGPAQRGPSMGQEDYQRMMMQQQHGQAVRAMASQSPAFNQQMMGSQQAQLLAAQQQQQHQGGSNYAMSPPRSGTGTPFGGMSAPSPTNSQNWGTPAQSGYPFGAGSPAVSEHGRHMSATPAPQQQHITPQNTPPAEQLLPNDFDLFNWNA